ncbi:MAG: iron-sulfur cluster assembly protein [Fimbriimonadaceae bacterium]
MPERVTEVEQPSPLDPIRRSLLENEVIEQIRTVYDPEIPVNVFDLGLIYAVEIQDDCSVDIKMTLTSPACPVAGTLPGEVQDAASKAPGIKEARLELVWDPPFTIDRIPDHIRLELGLL